MSFEEAGSREAGAEEVPAEELLRGPGWRGVGGGEDRVAPKASNSDAISSTHRQLTSAFAMSEALQ